MRKRFVLVLLTSAFTLMFSRDAKGSVECITEVSYYEPTNSILAWAETVPDYETLLYYDVGHWGYVRKYDEPVRDFYGQNYETEVYYEEFFPYDPDADYVIEVYPTLTVKYHHAPGDTYADYYNYVEWTYGNQVYAPYSFGFTGPGPDVGISFSSILLGYVFSIFTQGGTSGPPHHLRVIHDHDVVRNDLCGQLQKLIQFQVVDQQHRAAGQVALDEAPVDVTDTCSGTKVTLSKCETTSTTRYGNFTDGIKTGCPHTGPSLCGFLFYDTWRWCRNTSPYTPPNQVGLACMEYSATRTLIKVDGEADIPNLSYKY